MAMVVKNNVAAQMALGELRKNNDKLSKDLKQVASGMKINGAGDGAAEFSISEKMRVKIRALSQAKDNVSKGRDMLNLASQAIDQQVNIFQKVHTIAMRASDDAYTDDDRRVLNKEASQLLNESEDIAQQTTYNGRILLNERRLTSVVPWFDADVPYHENYNNVISLSQLASGPVSTQEGTYVAITTNPANTWDPNGGVQAGATATQWPSTTTSSVPVWNNLTNASDTLTYDATTDPQNPVWRFSNGTAASQPSDYATLEYATQITTLPAVGARVSATADVAAGALYNVAQAPGSDAISYFQTSTGQYTQEIDFASLFNAGLSIPTDLDGVGFSIECGQCDQFVTVQFDADTDASNLYIGEKSTKNPKPMCYVIGIANVTDENSLKEAVFNGIAANKDPERTAPDNTSLPSATDVSANIADRHTINLNYYANTGKLTITKDGPPITFENGVIGEMKEDDGFRPEQLLSIQGSDKAGQETKVKIPNTTLAILFPSSADNWDIEPTEGDYPQEWPKEYDGLSDAQKQVKWREEVWPYPQIGGKLDFDDCLSTRAQASAFLDRLSQAMKYLLDSNTTLGAQSKRMDYYEDNLVTENTQVQASESTVRDADMARAMTSYVKSNVLSQSASAMLAQANQQPSSVLSLLQ